MRLLYINLAALGLLLLAASCGGDAPGGSDGGPDSGPGPILGGDAGAQDAGNDGGLQSDGGCELRLFTSGSYDIDLHAVAISGTVTLGGQSAPESSPRGAVIFSSDLAGAGSDGGSNSDGGTDGGSTSLSTVSAALPNTGAASYSTRLFAGNYDASFSKSGACTAGLLPCGTQLLMPALSLFTSGSLQLDVHPTPGLITVSGTVTKNGAQLPSGSRGKIEFVLAATGSNATGSAGASDSTFPSSGDATYSVQLSPGAYDLQIVPPNSCAQSSPLPCQTFVARHAFALNSSGSLAIDLTVVQLSGAVTANGQALADASASRGQLSLLDSDGNGPSLDLGMHGAATYSVNLYAGAHDLSISPPQPCSGPLPCGKHLAAQAVAVSVSGSYTLDLPIEQVSGKVTTNGQQPGSAAHGSTRGALQFALGKELFGPYDLGASGAATYNQKLYSGTYQISLLNPLDCPNGPFPCGTGTLQASAPITTNGALDLDAKVAHLTLDATVNGAAFPLSPSSSPRGTVTFHGPTEVVVSLPGTGSASAPATVYIGNHDLIFSNTNDCPDGPAPCQIYKAASGKTISADGMVTVDLPVLDLAGHVTSNGQTLGASMSGGARGSLQLVNSNLGTVPVSLQQTGDLNYKARIFPATYQIDFLNTTDCPGTLPCQAGALANAVSIQTSGSLDIDIPVVTLSGTVTLDGAPLNQSGSGGTRGILYFGSAAVDLGASGAARYQTSLLTGSYPIRVENSLDCGGNGALPCGATVVNSCSP